MMRSFSILSIVAFASITLASSNPFIPDGISPTCSSFLTSLNKDASLAQCLSSLLDATKAVAPGAALPNSTASTLSTTLASVCPTHAACSYAAVRSLLTNFYAACTDELVGSHSNDRVKTAYDVLYLFTPLKSAICSKDSSTNAYCVLSIGTAVPSSLNGTSLNSTSLLVTPAEVPALSDLGNHLQITIPSGSQTILRRADTSAPNATTFRNTALPYLFMLSSSSPSRLCTPCGKAILSSYVTWESNTPYALGLSNSPILGAQLDLWNSVTSKCGASFMNAITAGTAGAPLGALAGGATTLKGGAGVATAVGAVILGLALLM